jgi:hypothetical protein
MTRAYTVDATASQYNLYDPPYAYDEFWTSRHQCFGQIYQSIALFRVHMIHYATTRMTSNFQSYIPRACKNFTIAPV